MRAIAGLEGHVSHAPAASMRAIHYRINGTSPLHHSGLRAGEWRGLYDDTSYSNLDGINVR